MTEVSRHLTDKEKLARYDDPWYLARRYADDRDRLTRALARVIEVSNARAMRRIAKAALVGEEVSENETKCQPAEHKAYCCIQRLPNPVCCCGAIKGDAAYGEGGE